MRAWIVTLALCVVGARSAAVQQAAGAGAGGRADAGGTAQAHAAFNINTDRWYSLLSDYTRGAGIGGWFPPPIPIQVPLQGDSSGRSSMSVLVVPMPVYVPAPRTVPTQCDVNAPQPPADTRAYTATPNAQQYNTQPLFDSQQIYNTQPVNAKPPVYNTQPPYQQVQVKNQEPEYNPGQVYSQEPIRVYQPDSYTPVEPSAATEPAPPVPVSVASKAPPKRVRRGIYFPPVEDSRVLVEQFRAQVASDPMLPPVVIEPVAVISTDDYTKEEVQAMKSNQKEETVAGPDRRRLKCTRRKPEPSEEVAEGVVPPLPPRFESSLYVRARLTVPRADYTETYAVWWDAASGASRIDFHGGTTSTYRMMKPDGLVQSVKIQLDRTGESDVRRCVVTTPRRVSLTERALPALPDLRTFSFAGYVVRGAERAERWRYTLSGHSGELGAARGEALTFRHELLVLRAADNYTTTPLWYSVRVDSSVLGTDCDGYVHYFDEVTPRQQDPAMFQLDIADACEQVETNNRMENVEPLREFTMLRRDPRYDAEIYQYKQNFERRYADDVEEAVRKNVLMQTVRQVTSGNRQGASFEMDVNFIADRLRVERAELLGVQETAGAPPGEPFPHSREELEALRGRLPRSFDWRKHGAVTPVRNQGICMSCWAFSTVGAVEGALFLQTGRLVPLSEQALVDCAGPYGANGCKPGTWPTYAYNYMKDKGIPALDDYQYTSLRGNVGQCHANRVPPVTRISSHLNVTRDNILALKVAIKKYGPTVVIIDSEVDSFMTFSKKYYHDAKCKKDKPRHAVLAVGWSVYRGETYFILKNSWTTAWGEQGYVRMRASTNTCGVLRRASLPRLTRDDVLRVPAGARAAATPPAA